MKPEFPELQTYFEAQRLQVEDSMKRHMGDSTVCEIHKSGRVSGGLKYDEGRLVVYGTLLRMLRTAPETIVESAAQELARWQAQLERYQVQQPRSMAWIAYSQGGVDACTAALAYLQQV